MINNKDYFYKYEVLVVSSGGSGCTFINEKISKHLPELSTNPTDNVDNFKHLYSPHSHLMHYNKFKKIIFVYNDPLKSILSHFRRGWAVMQHKQIAPISEHIDYDLLESKESYFNYVVNQKKDGFGVINHAKRWLNYDQCLFVDLREAKTTSRRISEYLGIDIDINLKQRTSKLDSINPKVIDLYQKWDSEIQNKIKL